jgi:hypothetical protein
MGDKAKPLAAYRRRLCCLSHRSKPKLGHAKMADYYSVIARAVSHFPHNDDEARNAIYEQARTALHKRLANDPQISDADLVDEHYRLEAAIYRVEEDRLLSIMRRFVREEPGVISKIKELVRSARDKFWGR